MLAEKPIEVVLAEHTDWLMSMPGVVGTAQAECQGRPCIKVLVAERTPEVEQIPRTLQGYPVEIEKTGPIRAT